MRATRLIAGLTGLVFCAISLNAAATDWYIDPVNGSDTAGDGSQGNPWKTLTYANSQTKQQGSREDPVALHALPGVYSASTNGETFPVFLNQGNSYPPGGGPAVPHFGALLGAGSHGTVLDAQNTDYVLRVSGCETRVSGLTVTAGSDGGIRASISYSPGSFTMEGCAIRDNTGGDGLRVFDAGAVVITDCEFTGNTCASSVTRGGAIAFNLRDHTITMTNCLIANNSVHHEGQKGGGIVFEAMDTPTFINCTIVDNAPHGVYCLGADNVIKFYNCVVWGHEDDILLEGGVSSEIYHSNIEDGDGGGQNGNISQEPLFVTGPQGDYYLSHAGVNAKKEEKSR